MADANTTLVVNVAVLFGGQCRWTRVGEFLNAPFFVASCGGSGSVMMSVVTTFEFCPWCGLEVKLK